LEKPTSIDAATTTTPIPISNLAATCKPILETNRPKTRSQMGERIQHTTTQPNHATHPTHITRRTRPAEIDPGESDNTRDANANTVHNTNTDIHTNNSNTTIASICTNGERRTAVHIPMITGKEGKMGKAQTKETVE
jgi:hypothetical protein